MNKKYCIYVITKIYYTNMNVIKTSFNCDSKIKLFSINMRKCGVRKRLDFTFVRIENSRVGTYKTL